MTFQVKEPILVIGLGGVGSKLANEAKKALNSDCLIISNDEVDFKSESESIKVSTDSVINPSIQLIRGSALKSENDIKSKISRYSTVVLMANLAGKTGSAIAPIVTGICKEFKKNTISFVIMPFKYENERIFSSGVSLKRVRANSDCTIVLDNDSMLENNPDMTPKTCYEISNSAILHVVKSLKTSGIEESSILTASHANDDMEESLRDALKMLYDNVPPNSVKSSVLYIEGGENIPVGVLNSISSLVKGITKDKSEISMSSSEESKVVMLSSVQKMTKFEKYDPLGIIPQENMLDWNNPDCSIDCKLDLYQIE